jgi:hypothetical protein
MVTETRRPHSTFTLGYSNRSVGNRGYVWANQPTAASYLPAAPYQANSSGAVNRITRSGKGNYRVILPNLGAAAGNVQVTAYGSGSEHCKVAYWNSVEGIRVKCYTATGNPVNTRFDVSFTGRSAIG